MIILEIDGNSFIGWQEVDITASMKEATRTFTLKTFNDLAGDIKGQSKCKIYDGSNLLLSGFIEVTEINYDANGSSASFTGRSLNCDLIDCQTEGKSFKGKNLKDIIKEVSSEYGVNVVFNVDLKNLTYTQPNQTETAFEYFHRLAERSGLVCTSNAKGDLVITRAGQDKLLGVFKKILSANSVDNYAERFSEYIIKGQTDTKNTTSTYKDTGVTRIRKKVVIDKTNDEELEISAKTQAIRRAGQGLTASYQVYDFYTDKGELYQPNKMIYINDERLRLNQLMLIEGVRYSVNNEGRKTTIDLVDPRAYFGEKPRINKSKDDLKSHPQATIDDKTILEKAIEAGKL